MKQKKIIIGIAGGSGSGKTRLVKNIFGIISALEAEASMATTELAYNVEAAAVTSTDSETRGCCHHCN